MECDLRVLRVAVTAFEKRQDGVGVAEDFVIQVEPGIFGGQRVLKEGFGGDLPEVLAVGFKNFLLLQSHYN